MKNTIALVTWEDTVTEDAWSNIQIARDMKPVLTRSVGFILFKTKKKIVLASMVSSNTHMCQLTCIPMGCVIEIKEQQGQKPG
jgi:hypothetical protein